MEGVSRFQGRNGASFVYVQFFPAFLSFPKGKKNKRKNKKTKQKALSLYTLCKLVIELDCWKKIIHYNIFVYNFLISYEEKVAREYC